MAVSVAVMFGGRSVEHEVSVITGIQALSALGDTEYDAFPVYIAKDGRMYAGDGVGDLESYKDIRQLTSKATEVILVRDGEGAAFTQWPPKRLGRSWKREVDVVLPAVHGTNAEDGTLQGYLHMLGVAYCGCDICSSALGMDKQAQKDVLAAAGIPVLPCVGFGTADYGDIDGIVSRCEEEIGYPMIVKPTNLGSSVGIGIASNDTELQERIDDAFLYSRRILVEHAVTELREINCSVLGDDDSAEASVCEEPLHSGTILSYSDKYQGGGKGGKGTSLKGGFGTKGASGAKGAGMASVARRIPADIPEEMTAEIQDMSVRAFHALGCSGVVRIDYILDEATGKVWLNEVNTIPGSLSFYLWKATGVSYPELLTRLVKIAQKRQRQESHLTYAFDTNILASGSLRGGKGAKGGKV